MVNTTFVTDSEANDWINEHTCELYELLVDASPPDYYASTTTITTASGQIQYALPADFTSLTSVRAVASQFARPLRPINDFNVGDFLPPQGAYAVTVEYIPAAPYLADGAGGDATAFDGVSGWENLIVKMTARDMMRKRKVDTQELEADIGVLKNRIRTAAANRDRGSPRYVVDAEELGGWYPSTNRIDGYRLRAGNIEFYTSFGGWR